MHTLISVYVVTSIMGYHAMALTDSFGMGDQEIINLLPAKFDPMDALIVGLRSKIKEV